MKQVRAALDWGQIGSPVHGWPAGASCVEPIPCTFHQTMPQASRQVSRCLLSLVPFPCCAPPQVGLLPSRTRRWTT